MILHSEPTCPEGFFLYPSERDGRTCYANTTSKPPDKAKAILKSCKAENNFLQRPALPSRPDLIDMLKPSARYNCGIWYSCLYIFFQVSQYLA